MKRKIAFVILLFFILLIGLILLLNSRYFQNYVVERLISPLEKEGKVNIQFDDVSFDIFKGLQLEHFEMQDSTGEKLLTFENLYISPTSTLLAALNNDFDIRNIDFDGLEIYYNKESGSSLSNWDHFLASLSSRPSNTSQSVSLPDISLEKINIKNGSVHYLDNDKRVNASITYDQIYVDWKNFDLRNGIYELSDLILDKPTIEVDACQDSVFIDESTQAGIDIDINNLPKLLIRQLSLLDAHFKFFKCGKLEQEVQNGDLLLENFVLNKDHTLRARLKNLSFSHDKINVRQCSVDDLTISDLRKISLKDARVRTDNSILKIDDFTAHDSTNNFNFFNLSNQYTLNIKESVISHSELYDLGLLDDKRSFLRGKKTYIDAGLYGSLANLDIRKLNVLIPEVAALYAVGNIKNARDLNAAIFDLTIQESFVDVGVIDQLFPQKIEGVNLTRLGKTNFFGNINGPLNNFIGKLTLDSEIGIIKAQANFENIASANYHGKLSLSSFNLGQFLGLKDMENVSGRLEILNGRGTTIEDMTGQVMVTIDSLGLNNYVFTNTTLNGVVSDQQFEGVITSADDNLDIKAEGILALLKDGTPKMNMDIDVSRADLHQLNLYNEPLTISLNSKINLKGKGLQSIEGKANLSNINLQSSDDRLLVNSIDIVSAKRRRGMEFELRSDELDAKLVGVFDLRSAHKVFLSILSHDYPEMARRLQIDPKIDVVGNENFDFDIHFKELSKILGFVKNAPIKDILGIARGRWTYSRGLSTNNIILKRLETGNVAVSNLIFDLDSDQGEGNMRLRFDSILYNNRPYLGFEIDAQIVNDTFQFTIFNDMTENNLISIQGQATPWKAGYKVNFNNPFIHMNSTQWLLDHRAAIFFDRHHFEIQNFNIIGDGKFIKLDDITNNGLELMVDNFDLGYINPLINYDKLDFQGSADMRLTAKNILKNRTINLTLDVVDFTINQDTFGALSIEAFENNNNVVDVALLAKKGDQIMDIQGYVDIGTKYVHSDMKLTNYPMNILEYIIEDGISNTSGSCNLDVKLKGPFDNLTLEGKGTILDGSTRIDYLGEQYSIVNQDIEISSDFIDFEDVVMLDSENNDAIMSGGLRHKMLADFKADISITSDYFIALNTTKDDNQTYYGKGVGDVTVDFDGPFDAVDIKVEAVAMAGSTLNIPIANSITSIDKGFINFDYKKEENVNESEDEKKSDRAKKLKGVQFEMNLSMTEEADVKLIFDQNVNEEISANGEGDIQFFIDRDGRFDAFGSYFVESGEYLYAAYGLIAKPFIIKRGGTVVWTGDPFNANLKIEAEYIGLRAPLDVLLSDLLISASERIISEASDRTNIALTLLLGGTLFNPEVNFDIDFPNVVGELKSYVDSKIRSLSATENGINNQVVGLLIFNNFLPSNNPLASISGNSLGQAGSRTITEFVTSQLSVLVSDYLSSQLKDNSIVEDIDFKLQLSQNISMLEEQSNLIQGLIDFVPDDVGLNLTPTFKNREIILNLGANYTTNGLNDQNYLTGDFAIDWYITKNRRLKLRFYGDYDYHETLSERRQKYGFGVYVRQEFGKLSNLKESLDNIAKEINTGRASSR